MSSLAASSIPHTAALRAGWGVPSASSRPGVERFGAQKCPLCLLCLGVGTSLSLAVFAPGVCNEWTAIHLDLASAWGM